MKTPNQVLVRAQQFAANVAIATNDPDWWHLLRMEAERVRDELHLLRSEMKDTQDAIEFLRDGWSEFGARPCPACLYVDGKFIRSCKLHQEIERLNGFK